MAYNSTAQFGLERASVYDSADQGFHPDVIRQRITHLLEQNPEDPYAYLFLGDLQAISNAYTEAIASYEQAIARDPTLAHGYFSLGVVYDKVGEREKAWQCMSKQSSTRVGISRT